MNRLISWIKRQGDQNSVTYSRFGLPGDETDDRPAPTQICVAPFDELDSAHFLCRKIHVARAALVCAGLGMSITVCVFIATFFEFNWYSHKRGVDVLALIGLLLFLVCGILTHWHVVVGVKKNHPKYLLPFIVVYVVMITAEGAMGVFGIYHYSILASIEVPDHVFSTKGQAYQFKEYHSALSAQVMFATLLFFAVFVVQGSMLWIVLRCRQFLERKMIHGIEMRVAEKSKLQYPSIQIVQAQPGEFALRAEDTNVEAGMANPNHQFETPSSQPLPTTPTLEAPPTHVTPIHRIGVAMESMFTPTPKVARPVDSPHHEQPAGGASSANGGAGSAPTRTLFSSSVE
ncbi:hypothetical protein PMAYCL1PPCAC_22562 [Pristionchus mayeri]|uniref:Uncharacterized protein n=1 Tax=Pristionchus mayeri TaxID=1317129 RepID=A0AAN5CXI2_9BILA|nr:hypothetical protein PMAYCL1PPCAC_22562 [Pristionchus mayeri]